MRKLGKIILIVVGLFIVAAIVMGRMAEKADGPRQSFQFLNTSEAVKSVTFEMINDDGTMSNTWYANEEVGPGDDVIKRLPPGNYLIKVWDDQESLYDTCWFAFQLPDAEKSNHHLMRFDLAMNKTFAVAYLNAVYSGNSFAEHMSEAVGTNAETLRLEETYDGTLPFMVEDKYTRRTWVGLGEKLPGKIKYGEVVYGLFAFPGDTPPDQLSKALYDEVAKLEIN
ncbi:MAG: hypothetical protein JJ975_03545 [Bacteroidia bacterium]|nr:hypothetical protein [Bacteroidia bacterium]